VKRRLTLKTGHQPNRQPLSARACHQQQPACANDCGWAGDAWPQDARLPSGSAKRLLGLRCPASGVRRHRRRAEQPREGAAQRAAPGCLLHGLSDGRERGAAAAGSGAWRQRQGVLARDQPAQHVRIAVPGAAGHGAVLRLWQLAARCQRPGARPRLSHVAAHLPRPRSAQAVLRGALMADSARQTYVSPEADRALCRAQGGNNSQGAIYRTQARAASCSQSLLWCTQPALADGLHCAGSLGLLHTLCCQSARRLA